MSISLLNLFSVFTNALFSIPALILLILDIIVLRAIWRNESRSESNKLLWSLVVFFFPFGGLIIYWLFGD
jgi:apolipoprotein N-acyltransferase